MRILWVTNQPIAKLRDMLGVPLGQSGGWMESAFEAIKDSSDFTLGIATIYIGSELLHTTEGGHDYFAVPSKQFIGKYDHKDEYNLAQWRRVVEEYKPDVIQIWGTEYTIGLCAQLAAKGIPSVVYMQGLMTMIAKHCLDGVDVRTQFARTSLYELLKGKSLWMQKKKYHKTAIIEEEILSNAQGVIVESNWCGGICSMISPKIRVFKSDLPINPVFSSYDWDYGKIERNSIFTVSGGYPVKGHHVLFDAISIVKKQFPDVKVYIPGASTLMRKLSFKEKIQSSSYSRILSNQIKKNGLQSNIVPLGRLTPQEMASKMATCHCFVMPSMIENHSSSLIEAMMVGLPTISSYVGGLNSYYKDGENGFFYRADEPEHLASLIIRYFEDEALCRKMSCQGMTSQRNRRQSINLKKDFESIYKSVVKA